MDSMEEAKEYNKNNSSSSSSNTNDNDHGTRAVVKGKRTKRQRLHPAPTSSTSSAEFSGISVTEEDEDMANCLMLLSRGRDPDPKPEPPAEEGFNLGGGANKLGEAAATTTDGKPGLHVYECKTCNKCFPSFQALGGHRASHKKPKTAAPPTDEDGLHANTNSFPKPAVAPNDDNYINSGVTNRTRVHECSICGSEFSSGQALGGHMRRHRPIATPAGAPEIKKERNVLYLDLNLPAPTSDDDHKELPTSSVVTC